MMKYNKGGGADMGAKKKKYNRPPQTRNKMQPSRSMSRDTTTGISKMKDLPTVVQDSQCTSNRCHTFWSKWKLLTLQRVGPFKFFPSSVPQILF